MITLNPPVPRRSWPFWFALPIFFLIAGWQVPFANAQEGLDHDLIWKPAISPDGSKAVLMDGKELRVVEIETGKKLQVLKGHEFTVYAVAYSPDGKRILSGDGNCLRLWDARTGKHLQRIEGRNGNLKSLAMTPDGRFAVSGHSAGSGAQLDLSRDLVLWDLKTGQVVSREKIVLDCWIAQHQFPGFYQLLPGKAQEQLPPVVRDLLTSPTHREECRFEGQKEVNCVAVSPDGKRVACGCEDGGTRVLELETGNEKCCLGWEESKGVLGVAFSPDGERVLVGTRGGEVSLWHVRGKADPRSFDGHKGAVYCVAFSPDGRRALSGGEDKTVRLWNLETGKELTCFRGMKEAITNIVFSADGKRVFCTGEGGSVRSLKLSE
jgi:WD40 repeat protein